MTPIEIGLTVAVVVLAFVVYAEWRGRSLTDAKLFDNDSASYRMIGDVSKRVAPFMEGTAELGEHLANHKLEIAQFIKLANGSEQKRDAEVKALWMEVFGDPAANRKNGLKQGLLDLATLSESHEKSLHELASKHLPVHASHDLLTVLEGQIKELRETVAGMRVSREVLTEFDDEPVFEEPVSRRYRLVPIEMVRPEAFADAAHAACPDPRWKDGDLDPETVAAMEAEEKQVTTLGEPVIYCIEDYRPSDPDIASCSE